MKNQKMLLMMGGTVFGVLGMFLIVVSLFSDASPVIGIFMMIMGTGVLATGILTKPQKDEPPPG